MSEGGSLYYIIPAEIMHNKDLDASHKCLYGQVAGLAKKSGYCWATNKYLAEMNDVSERHIQRMLQKLEHAGFLRIEIDQQRNRKIYVSTTHMSCGGTTHMSCGGTTHMSEGHDIQVVPYKEEDEVKEIGESKRRETPAAGADQIGVERTTGYIMARALLELIRKNKKYYSRIARYFSPEKEEASLMRWAKDFDLLLTRDAHPEDEAIKVLKWCQRDEFWQGQILSGGNFRKHYDTLLQSMNGTSCDQYGLPDEHPEVTQMLVKAYGWLCNNSNWKPNKSQMPKFIDAAERVIAFIDLHDRGLIPEELVGYLRDCLQEAFREKGEMVHPGHLRSDYTWNTLLPQYLETVIGAL